MIRHSEVTIKATLAYDDSILSEYDAQQAFLHGVSAAGVGIHFLEITDGLVNKDGVPACTVPTDDSHGDNLTRFVMFEAQAAEEIDVRDLGVEIVVLCSGTKVAEFLPMGVVADRPTMLAEAEGYVSKLRERFIALAMGTLREPAQ